jgi:UrcA family protein
MTRRHLSPIALLLGSSFALATPAMAQVTAAIPVRTADLDLSRPADVATLQHRVAAAVERGCTPEEWSDAAQPSLARQCREEAQRKADEQVAALTSSHRLAAALPAR